jgi:lipid A biosynthesis acyltransferase
MLQQFSAHANGVAMSVASNVKADTADEQSRSMSTCAPPPRRIGSAAGRQAGAEAPDGNHFHGEFTEPLDLPHDAQGLVDVQRTMQAITTVIEGWVREHPEQWLWLHRRWR